MIWQLQHVTPSGQRFPIADREWPNHVEPTDLGEFWKWFQNVKTLNPAPAVARWEFVRRSSPSYRELPA